MPSAIPQAPSPRERYPRQSLFVFRRDPLAFFLSLGKLGKLVRFRLLENEDWYLVNDPELIQRVFTSDNRHFVKGRTLSETKRILGEGLLTSEGELHHRQRRLIQPVFSRRKVEGGSRTTVSVHSHANPIAAPHFRLRRTSTSAAASSFHGGEIHRRTSFSRSCSRRRIALHLLEAMRRDSVPLPRRSLNQTTSIPTVAAVHSVVRLSADGFWNDGQTTKNTRRSVAATIAFLIGKQRRTRTPTTMRLVAFAR